MQPRIAFAILLALGAMMHLLVLISPPHRVGYLGVYLLWLLPSIAFALFVRAKSSSPRPLSARERQLRQTPSSGLWMEGLGLFVGIAAVGLVIHLFSPYREVSGWNPDIKPPSSRQWNQYSALSLMFILCAAGCWGLLRGAPGDTSAPIPDGSTMVRALGWLRRLAGIAIACWGAWLFVMGILNWGQSADGFNRLLNIMFVVGGPFWLFIGLKLARRRGRDDA